MRALLILGLLVSSVVSQADRRDPAVTAAPPAVTVAAADLAEHAAGLTAILRFDNVSSAQFGAHESAFRSVVAGKMGVAERLVAVSGVVEREGASGAQCARITVGGLAADALQAPRMGDYYHTRQTYGDHPVFYSSASANFIYYYPTKGWWLIGPTLGSEYASLLVNSDVASPLDIPADATWFVSKDSSWEQTSSLTFGCNPAPYVDVTFRVGMDDCADSAALGAMEARLRQRTIPMLTPLRAEGLLSSSVGLVRTHVKGCAPEITLEMPENPRAWALKTTCEYNGKHLMIKHHAPDSHHHFACKHKYDHFQKKWQCNCNSWPDVDTLPTPSPTPAPTMAAPVETTTPAPERPVETTTTTTTTTPAPTTDSPPSTPAPTSHTETDARGAFPQCPAKMLAECRKPEVNCQTASGVRAAQLAARLRGECPKPEEFDFGHSAAFKAVVPQNVEINHAGIAELSTIYGVDAQRAQWIVDYRKDHGYYRSVDELANINGISSLNIAAMFSGAKANEYGKPIVLWSDELSRKEVARDAPKQYGDWVFKDWWKMDETAPNADALKIPHGANAEDFKQKAATTLDDLSGTNWNQQ